MEAKRSNPHPPKWPLTFMRWVIREDYLEEIEGDMEEVFQDNLERYSLKKAKRLYTVETLKLLRPAILKHLNPQSFVPPTAMFKHNLIISYRGFLRSKTTFLINLIGLGTGLACAMLIFLWVQDELSVDTFHEKDSQLYQVMHNLMFQDRILTFDATPVPLADALVEEIPEIESALAISRGDQNPIGILTNGDNHLNVKGIYAGENFFDVLSYPLLHGNSELILSGRNNIVLTEQLALNIFSSVDNAIGKTLEYKDQRFEGLFQVAGVCSSPPAHGSTQFDFILPLQQLLDLNEESREWYSSHAQTFLIVKKETNIDQLNEKIVDFIKGRHSLSSDISSLFVQKFSHTYLYNQYENGKVVGGRIRYVNLFSLIALFILAIACINFMNLSTAQASKKMKEIGVKKAIGAGRKALIAQFLGESVLVTIISLTIAIGLLMMLLPQFNDITGKNLHFDIGLKGLLLVLGLVLVTGIAAGSYPALYLSSFSPITALKGNLDAGSRRQWARKSLVIFQFTLSIIFIVGVLVINQQIEYTQSKNLGYQRDHVISFQRKGKQMNNDCEIFMAELKKIPGVVQVSNVHGDFLEAQFGNSNFSWDGITEEQQFPYPSPEIGYDFIKTMGMEILAGRSFSNKYNDDQSNIIINEAAAKMMGFEDAVGQMIKFADNDRQIIGIVKDFNLKSLHQSIEPLFLGLDQMGPMLL